MKIVPNYPPNYKEICSVFDLNGIKPVFTYGNILYNPHNQTVGRDLLIHEEVHCRQQGNNPAEWWDKYLKNFDFRISQEVEAYAKQYKFLKGKTTNEVRKNALSFFADTLSSKLYGNIISKKQALKLISNFR